MHCKLYLSPYAMSTRGQLDRCRFQHQFTVGAFSFPSLIGGSCPNARIDAHIICSTAKTRFDPSGSVQASDAGTQDGGQADLESYKRAYKPVHQNQSRRMYFMVSRNGHRPGDGANRTSHSEVYTNSEAHECASTKGYCTSPPD